MMTKPTSIKVERPKGAPAKRVGKKRVNPKKKLKISTEAKHEKMLKMSFAENDPAAINKQMADIGKSTNTYTYLDMYEKNHEFRWVLHANEPKTIVVDQKGNQIYPTEDEIKKKAPFMVQILPPPGMVNSYPFSWRSIPKDLTELLTHNQEPTVELIHKDCPVYGKWHTKESDSFAKKFLKHATTDFIEFLCREDVVKAVGIYDMKTPMSEAAGAWRKELTSEQADLEKSDPVAFHEVFMDIYRANVTKSIHNPSDGTLTPYCLAGKPSKKGALSTIRMKYKRKRVLQGRPSASLKVKIEACKNEFDKRVAMATAANDMDEVRRLNKLFSRHELFNANDTMILKNGEGEMIKAYCTHADDDTLEKLICTPSVLKNDRAEQKTFLALSKKITKNEQSEGVTAFQTQFKLAPVFFGGDYLTKTGFESLGQEFLGTSKIMLMGCMTSTEKGGSMRFCGCYNSGPFFVTSNGEKRETSVNNMDMSMYAAAFDDDDYEKEDMEDDEDGDTTEKEEDDYEGEGNGEGGDDDTPSQKSKRMRTESDEYPQTQEVPNDDIEMGSEDEDDDE